MRVLAATILTTLMTLPISAQSIIPAPENWTPSIEIMADAQSKVFRSMRGELGVRGDGTDSSFWRTPAIPISPASAYVLRFKAQGDGSGGIIAGLNTVNRDFYTQPSDWTSYNFAFRTPDQLMECYLRLGHWNYNGKLAFTDAELHPASVAHRRWDDMELGEGEMLMDGDYSDTHTLSWRGSTIHRTLFRQNAFFNTNRWCISPGSDVVYRYEFPFNILSVHISSNVNYHAGGMALISVSTDGQNWTRIAGTSNVAGIEADVPSSFFPTKVVYIRLHSEGSDANVQFDRYSLQAKVDYHCQDRIGDTSVIEQVASITGIDVKWEQQDRGWKVDFTNNGSAPISANVLIRQDGVWQQRSRLNVPAGSTAVRVVNSPSSAGRHEVGLQLVDAGKTMYSAQTEFIRTVIEETGYGSMLDSDLPGIAVWCCEGARKVGLHRPLPARRQGNTISIEAARGEWEPLQIVLRPNEPGIILEELSPSDLVGPNGRIIHASEIDLMEVATVPVEHPSDYLGTPGRYPDPLPPLTTPMNLSVDVNQAIWVSVHVPEGTPPGDYIGTLTIRTDHGTLTPRLKIHVFDFDLPKASHLRSAFVLDHGMVNQYHKPQTPEQERQIWEMYMQSYADHRISPNSFYPYDNIDIRFEGEGDDKRVILDFTAFDKAVDQYMNKFRFNAFSLWVAGMGGGTFYDRVEGEFGGFKADTPGYDRLFGDYLRQLENHLAEKGILDKAYVYWFDEPDIKDFPFVIQGMDRLHRFAPGLKRLLTKNPYPELIGHVDLWVGLTPTWTPEIVAERRKAGDEAMWYICCGPTAPYIGEFIEHPAVEMRLWPWQSWQYGIQGILVWDTNYWTSTSAFPESLQNPWDDPQSYVNGYGTPAGTKAFWGNGDGRFFYPPRRDPNAPQPPDLNPLITSIRWENLRDGMEDYEYLFLLEQEFNRIRDRIPVSLASDVQSLLKVPETVSKSTTSFTYDPSPLLTHRHRVAEMIERLQKMK